MKPNGRDALGRDMKELSLNSDLLERIMSVENVRKAWKRVRANKGVPGVDGISVKEFPDAYRQDWLQIRLSILEGTYKPSPALRVEIPKKNGAVRLLGIPTVLDRLIQQSISQILGLIFDDDFSSSSFGFRPGKSAHDAVRKLREIHISGYKIAVDVDLAKFFDTVNHDILMHRISRKIQDKSVLKLIGKYLRAGVKVKGRCLPTRKGVPQGGPLSPLLANILLDDLDKELEKRGHKFVRYADDFIIMVKSISAGDRVMSSVSRFLSCKLKLVVNENKSKVAPLEECSYLGFIFVRGAIRWSDIAFHEFKRRLRLLTGRSWFVSMKYRYKKLAEYIRGWMNYYGISEYYRPTPIIDKWLRRRLRMCYWKQWRYARTKVRNLIKNGTFLRYAIKVAMSRKGPWRLSKTLATQSGMTNRWLKQQGLISVKEQWCRVHYPANAR